MKKALVFAVLLLLVSGLSHVIFQSPTTSPPDSALPQEVSQPHPPSHQADPTQETTSSSLPALKQLKKQGRMPSEQQKILGFNESVAIVAEELPAKIISGRGWHLASDVRARRIENFHQQGQLIERRKGVVFYRVDSTLMAANESADADEFLVLYQPRSRQVAVLLGRISVQLHELHSLNDILHQFNLVVEAQRPNINFVSLRPRDRNKLFSIAEQLSQDPRIKIIKLETAHLNLVPQ